MSWSNDVIIEFIEQYKRESVLWDPKHENYKSKGEGSSAWSRIQSNLSQPFSIMDLKKKKESLMTTFRLHCSKKRLFPKFQSKWFAFPYLESFLGTKYECDSTNDHGTLDDSANESYITYSHGSTKDGAETERENKSKKSSTKLKRKLDCSTNSESEDPLSITKNSIESRREEPDEYDLYGQLLVQKLRKLDEHQRDVAMHEIDNIMFQTKMQSRNPSSHSNMRSPMFIVTQDEEVNYEPYHEQEIHESPR